MGQERRPLLGETEEHPRRMAVGQSQTRLALDFRAIAAPWTRLPWTLGPWAALGLPGRKRDAGANFVPQRIPLNKQPAKVGAKCTSWTKT